MAIVSELWNACEVGDVNTVSELLKNATGDSMEVKDDTGATPLIIAVKGGHAEIVRILLAHGADPFNGNPEAHTNDGDILQILDMAKKRALSATSPISPPPTSLPPPPPQVNPGPYPPPPQHLPPHSTGYSNYGMPAGYPPYLYMGPPPAPGQAPYPYYGMPPPMMQSPPPPRAPESQQPNYTVNDGTQSPQTPYYAGQATEVTKTIPCRYYPNCKYGSQCLYFHPSAPYNGATLPPPAHYPPPHLPQENGAPPMNSPAQPIQHQAPPPPSGGYPQYYYNPMPPYAMPPPPPPVNHSRSSSEMTSPVAVSLVGTPNGRMAPPLPPPGAPPPPGQYSNATTPLSPYAHPNGYGSMPPPPPQSQHSQLPYQLGSPPIGYMNMPPPPPPHVPGMMSPTSPVHLPHPMMYQQQQHPISPRGGAGAGGGPISPYTLNPTTNNVPPSPSVNGTVLYTPHHSRRNSNVSSVGPGMRNRGFSYGNGNGRFGGPGGLDKTRKPPCMFFPAGKCRNGDHCKFAHLTHEQMSQNGFGPVSPRSRASANTGGMGGLEQKMSELGIRNNGPGPRMNGAPNGSAYTREGSSSPGGYAGRSTPDRFRQRRNNVGSGGTRQQQPVQRVPTSDDFPDLVPSGKVPNGQSMSMPMGPGGLTAAQVLSAPAPLSRKSTMATSESESEHKIENMPNGGPPMVNGDAAHSDTPVYPSIATPIEQLQVNGEIAT